MLSIIHDVGNAVRKQEGSKKVFVLMKETQVVVLCHVTPFLTEV